MHPEDEGKGQEENEEREREEKERDEEKEEEKIGASEGNEEVKMGSYQSPPGAKITPGVATRMVDSPETPATPEMDESLRSALERINSSSKKHGSVTQSASRRSPGSALNRSQHSTAGASSAKRSSGTQRDSLADGTDHTANKASSMPVPESSFDSDRSIDLSLSSPPKNFDIQEPGTPPLLFGGIRAPSSASRVARTTLAGVVSSSPVASSAAREESGAEEDEGPNFPVAKVSLQDFNTAPTFITYQTDVQAINRCVQRINREIASRRHAAEEDEDTVPLEEAQQDCQGTDSSKHSSKGAPAVFSEGELAVLVPRRADVLALVTLKRLDMVAEQSGTKTYIVPESRARDMC
jgi:hypothetical protein